MAFIPFTNGEIEVGKPNKKSLWQKIKDNFADLDSRVNALDILTGKTIIFEKTQRDLLDGIGEIRSAQLTEAQFEKMYGPNWVLCNGQSVAGSTWAVLTGQTTAPDARGEFWRGLDNSRGVDAGRTMFSTQNGQNPIHQHSYNRPTGITTVTVKSDTFGSPGSIEVNSLNSIVASSSGNNADTSAGSTNGNETRPRNLATNYFLKINPDSKMKFLVWQAKENTTITQVKITNIIQQGFDAPTSGNFTIDIRKGATLDTLATIFTVTPTVTGHTEGSTNGAVSFVVGGQYVLAGEWLVLDITSLQVGQSQCHIDIFGEPT